MSPCVRIEAADGAFKAKESNGSLETAAANAPSSSKARVRVLVVTPPAAPETAAKGSYVCVGAHVFTCVCVCVCVCVYSYVQCVCVCVCVCV
jgi:hypothetical protein